MEIRQNTTDVASSRSVQNFFSHNHNSALHQSSPLPRPDGPCRKATQRATEEPSEASPPPAKKTSKKRKRNDLLDTKDTLKDKKRKVKSEHEGSADSDAAPEKDVSLEPEIIEEDLAEEPGPSLASYDADRVLQVLDSVDPVHILDQEATVRGNTTTLRTCLQNPSSISLRALRERIRHETPTVETRTTPPNIKVVKFFQLAKDLLDDIAEKTVSPLTLTESLDPTPKTEDEADEKESPPKTEGGPKPIKYALHQHLPTGDYFTSAASLTAEQVNALTKGQASILGVARSQPLPSEALPELGEYARGPAFIDYGLFSSLAPTFDSEGGQVGRETLGLVADSRKARRRQKLAALKTSISARSASPPLAAIDPFPSEWDLLFASQGSFQDRYAELKPLVEDFLPKDMIQSLMDGLDDLELENGLSELLVHNGRALRALQELQESRFRAGTNGKEVPVTVGGEEWQLARQILSSLVTLVSLRPRASSSTSKPHSLVPPPSLLHTLQRTLPRDAIPGWKGTLSTTRDFALIDNATLRANSSTLPIPPPANAAPPASSTPLPSIPPPAPMPAAASRPPAATYSYTRPTATTSTSGYGTAASRGGTATYYPQGYTPIRHSHTTVIILLTLIKVHTIATPAMDNRTPQSSQTPVTPARAIPNLASKSTPATLPTWGTPTAAAAAGSTAMAKTGPAPNTPAPALPAHLRRVNGAATGVATQASPGTWSHSGPSTPTPASRTPLPNAGNQNTE
ncbi:hypothetical protein BS47DRAFT_1481798 [Hydnum rufescens UP504]|uniref:Uncharacterized protein n=1 Tax=Hydnum rufescens UP504 TaxID=1448309 RepID=A0A9P6BAH5_9AGAM|nr:hypothetical protein BS47DRAFT_1481798 [Hydnum rufescens UP504]